MNGIKWLEIISESFVLVLLLGLAKSEVHAQQDTLIIFTQKSCGNCAYTKMRLEETKTPFVEYHLKEKANASKMLSKLRSISYNGRIGLPVMFLNDTIIHPVQQVADTFNSVVLSEEVEKVIERLSKWKSEEASQSRYAVIVKNTTDEEEAKAYVEQLKEMGYSEANYVNYNRMYRVYINAGEEKGEANRYLNAARNSETFKYVYLLEIMN